MEAKPINLPAEDFFKFDIRVGTVLSAKPVPKSKKLLEMQIRFGDEIGTRTILAGIAEAYNPEWMLGRSVVAVLNLAPRMMMGIQSDGMLLASKTVNGAIVLMHPNTAAQGAEVG